MSSVVMPSPEAIAVLARALVMNVFDEHDPVRRADAISQVFASNIHFEDPAGVHTGHEELEQAVLALHARLPECRFNLTSEPQSISCSGRVTWAFGPPDDPQRVTGMDVIMVRDGRVSILLTFLDPAPAASPTK
jgi:ketosteroid isomerase-like protein